MHHLEPLHHHWIQIAALDDKPADAQLPRCYQGVELTQPYAFWPVGVGGSVT